MEISKHDLQVLSQARLDDATTLLQAGRYSGAYYLAGYAIELAIKACIAGNFRAGVLPDNRYVQKVYSHNLEELIGLAGLGEAFKRDRDANAALAGSWGVVKDWNEQSRYAIWDAISARVLLQAIADPKNGILQWLRTHF